MITRTITITSETEPVITVEEGKTNAPWIQQLLILEDRAGGEVPLNIRYEKDGAPVYFPMKYDPDEGATITIDAEEGLIVLANRLFGEDAGYTATGWVWNENENRFERVVSAGPAPAFPLMLPVATKLASMVFEVDTMDVVDGNGDAVYLDDLELYSLQHPKEPPKQWKTVWPATEHLPEESMVTGSFAMWVQAIAERYPITYHDGTRTNYGKQSRDDRFSVVRWVTRLEATDTPEQFVVEVL